VLANFFLSLERWFSGEKAPFVYPVPPAPRTAVLVPWFAEPHWLSKSWLADQARLAQLPQKFAMASPIRVFPSGWCSEAAEYEPAAVAATFPQLQTLLSLGIDSMTHAVIVLGRPAQPRLTEEDRHRLWRAFAVPIFEQVIGPNGELLAAECEAHDGLHVENPAMPLQGETVHDGRCLCGKTTPRIGVTDGLEAERRVAAYAR
jgi:hypothetical protein